MRSRPDYGTDSPVIVAGLILLSGMGFGSALASYFVGHPHSIWRIGLVAAGSYFLLAAGGMVWYSKVGKLQIRDHVVELVPWRGDEMVLDVGCGRGLLLIGAAHRLTTGKAIGLDLWVHVALTGNRPEAVLDNAQLEGVLNRVEVKEGDARKLPFPDGSFDVILSNFVVHEVNTQAEREQMLCEMVRVLKPGGRLAMVDFVFTGQCVEALRQIGIIDAMRTRVGSSFSFWFSAIFNFGLVQIYQVTGSKPSMKAANIAEAGNEENPAEPLA